MRNDTKDIGDKELMLLNEAFSLAIGWKRRGKKWVDPLGNEQIMPPPYFKHDALAWGGMARNKALGYSVEYFPVSRMYEVKVKAPNGKESEATHNVLATAICTAVARFHGRWDGPVVDGWQPEDLDESGR